MRTDVFNACLLGGWFMLTLGGILLSPGAGLLIGGVALIMLTLFVALRVGFLPPTKKSADDKGA